ncbi:hypothetical protein [Marinobacter sp. UBA2498]|uniref:hypothetical protein n=1 Tax=Marinobacter sp. UBA2498 TaxID=1946813 RepID=UPI00257B324B|nr:hypothetical protein [Marinobacter sp. UBA2498]
MIRLRLWRRRDDEPAPVDLRFYPDPGIILELLRPREPTPGPVTLQFGRYEPPEYPTVPGTLTASLPPPDVPALVLTATGESTAPTVAGQLLAEIPGPVLPALSLLALDETLRGNLLADMPAVAVSLGFNAEGYQDLDLPDADGASVGMRWREFSPSRTGLTVSQQEMRRAYSAAAIRDGQALPLHRWIGIQQSQSIRMLGGRRIMHQHGERLGGHATQVRHSESVKIRQAFVTEHQHGIRLRAHVRQRYADTVKLRTFRALSEQQGVPVAGVITIRSGQGALLSLRLKVRHTHAIHPPPGLATWPPPVEPEPPSPDDGGVFRFCRRQDGTTTLVFGCPDSGKQTIIIPIREIYTVINSVTLTELNGTPVPAEEFSASIDADSWTWSWSARIPGSALSQVRPDSSTRVELIATINGEPLRVLVESIQRERRFGESWLRVSGRGRAAFLADPIAPVIQYTNATAMTAQQALAEALTLNGVPIGWTLDWQIEDWQIPAGIWSHSGTWIDAAKRIAEAGGAYVQGHDTDPVLRILPRYPVAPWNWGSATPDIQLPEDVVEVEGIEWQEKPEYNAVWVHGGDQGRADRIIIGDSGGTNPAPTIVDELATDPVMTRQRGLAVLGDTGKQARISLRLPVLPETGIIRPGALVEYLEQGNTRRGLVRSLNISHNRPELWQTIGVETHE